MFGAGVFVSQMHAAGVARIRDVGAYGDDTKWGTGRVNTRWSYSGV